MLSVWNSSELQTQGNLALTYGLFATCPLGQGRRLERTSFGDAGVIVDSYWGTGNHPLPHSDVHGHIGNFSRENRMRMRTYRMTRYIASPAQCYVFSSLAVTRWMFFNTGMCIINRSPSKVGNHVFDFSPVSQNT